MRARILKFGLVVVTFSLAAVVTFQPFVWSHAKPSGGALSLKQKFAATDRVEVLSLQPSPKNGEVPKNERRFHGLEVLGGATLDATEPKQSAAMSTILKALDATIADPMPNTAKGCVFTPRHGLRIRSNGKTIDLVVCLECGDVDVGEKRYWLDGKEARASLRSALNRPLKDAGVELAKGAE